MRTFRAMVFAWVCAGGMLAGGCASDAMPWEDSPATVAAKDAKRTTDSAGRTVVVVAPLRNPQSAPIKGSTVGPGFANAIRTDLQNNSQIALRDEPLLGAEINNLLAQDEATIKRRLPALAARYPQVRLVVAGDVIRFTHKLGLNSTARRDAEVVVELTLIDLPAARIIGKPTFTAQAWSDQSAARLVKPETAFGSAEFWDSPLGLASRDVVNDAAARIVAATPARIDGQIAIVDVIDERNLVLSRGPMTDASVGDVMFVCLRHSGPTEFTAVIDPNTRRPLTARVSEGGREPTAWLMGSKPANSSLVGAVLCRQPAPAAKAEQTAQR